MLPLSRIAVSHPPLFSSMKIARGTAYAAGNRITVEQFFERGAAIGVQRRQHGTNGGDNQQGYWDNEAVFALSKVRFVIISSPPVYCQN